jgi:phage gp36-like protein
VNYCTAQDLIDRFGEAEILQRTDRARTGSIDYSVAQMAIDDACAEIDDYLTDYALPLSSVPLNLKKRACDIARNNLFYDMQVEVVESNYRSAIEFLKGVSSGKFKLGLDQNGASQEQSSGSIYIEEQSPIMSDQSLSSF